MRQRNAGFWMMLPALALMLGIRIARLGMSQSLTVAESIWVPMAARKRPANPILPSYYRRLKG